MTTNFRDYLTNLLKALERTSSYLLQTNGRGSAFWCNCSYGPRSFAEVMSNTCAMYPKSTTMFVASWREETIIYIFLKIPFALAGSPLLDPHRLYKLDLDYGPVQAIYENGYDPMEKFAELYGTSFMTVFKHFHPNYRPYHENIG